MATNKYFNNGFSGEAPEQRLLQDLTDENIKIYGQNFAYLPRTMVKEDKLFGEDYLSQFKGAYQIEMLLENVQEYGGQGDFISKFGIEVDDEAKLIASRRSFYQATGKDYPTEGDLIYFPTGDALFEISWVEHENPFWQLGKLTTFVITVKLFSFSQEDFDTDIDDIDAMTAALENDNSVVNDAYADNADIETEGDEIIDFTEDNPFGNFGNS